MRKIIIIQHCQSEHHINDMSGGWTDTPLTELGRKQANLLGMKLKESIKSEEYVLYSSDLLRAKQTAEIVGSLLKLDVVINPDLRELNTGVAAGKTKKWASENKNPMPEVGFDIDHRLFDGGETWREFYSRICKCMKQIYDSEKKNLIIVTHGGALHYIIAWWFKFTGKMISESVFRASPGSISILSKNIYDQNEISLLNDASHLIGL